MENGKLVKAYGEESPGNGRKQKHPPQEGDRRILACRLLKNHKIERLEYTKSHGQNIAKKIVAAGLTGIAVKNHYHSSDKRHRHTRQLDP